MDGVVKKDPNGVVARLAKAFSLRRNLGLLFVAPAEHLRPLDGWRALSVLWVVVFHAGWYVGRHVPVHVYAALLTSPWMLPLWRGDFGVDVFFVLSGFLITGMLIDEHDRNGRVNVALFYVRRLMRLWPALVVAVIVYVLSIGDQAEKVWANLLYINNFLPILHACMGWTWSLAVEEQFYLVSPWLVIALVPVRFRARIAALAAVALVLGLVAVGVVVAGGFHAIDSDVVVNRDFGRWAVGYDHLYVKPWMRAGPLLAGVASAYVFRHPRAMEALARGRVLPAVGLMVALVTAAASTHWQLAEGAPRALEVGYLAAYRTVFGVAVAYLLLLSVSQNPIGRLLGRALSSRVFYPIAQLAYSAYLLNPIVTTLVHQELAPLVWTGKASPMPLFLPLDVLGTFAAAAVVYVLVERPIMELRPRGRQAPKGAAAP